MNSTDSGSRKIHSLLKDFSTAMLITLAAEGQLHARPMAIAGLEEDCSLWFFTNDSGSIASEVASDSHAHVICQKDYSSYLSIQGKALLTRDRARAAELWKESFRVWFPSGKDDPDLALVSFRPERAEYWDTTGLNKAAYLWEAARAYVSGDTPQITKEQHGVVGLSDKTL